MQHLAFLVWFVTLPLVGSLLPPHAAHNQLVAAVRPIYVSPRPGATLVSAGTTIALRFGREVSAQTLTPALFDVVGSRSGVHTGRTVLADDRTTAIFKPAHAFAYGETVTVRLAAGLQTTTGAALSGLTFSFTIRPAAPVVRAASTMVGSRQQSQPARAAASEPTMDPAYRTVPDDVPVITATVATEQRAPGQLFVTTFGWQAPAKPSYALILDQGGQPLYYQRFASGTLVTDFKVQPNGLLTYFEDRTDLFHALDATYTEVATYRAGNGYLTDAHDLQILPNGHALLMIYDGQIIDMSQVVAGGLPEVSVFGLVVQELDTLGNVVFEWRSWDHFAITDTTDPIANVDTIDYVHGNALELDRDGNILLSSRHMDEITKIDRATGEMIWRLGGKQNQFTFVNDQPFAHQHDIRRLANGHITLFDNRNGLTPSYSRAVEYALDEQAKTITRVWDYRNTPDVTSIAMGSAQRLANGNTLIGWGSSTTKLLTEVAPDGTNVFELIAEAPLVSYRAFRFPWHVTPPTSPTLVVEATPETTILAYSWNGATEVQAYRVYGGMTAYPTTLLATESKTGLETTTTLADDQRGMCFFRVVPIDAAERELHPSPVVRNSAGGCPPFQFYLPVLPVAQ